MNGERGTWLSADGRKSIKCVTGIVGSVCHAFRCDKVVKRIVGVDTWGA